MCTAPPPVCRICADVPAHPAYDGMCGSCHHSAGRPPTACCRCGEVVLWRRHRLCLPCHRAVKAGAGPLPCRHCKDGALTWRRRGLCWKCFGARRIRAIHAQFVRCGMGAVDDDFTGSAKLPADATDAEPGSEGKVDVMAGRAGRREALHHERDAKSHTGAGTMRVHRARLKAIVRLAEQLAEAG